MSACPVPGCASRARPGQLLCPPHWRQVPSALKSKVWITWRAFTGAVGSQAQMDARRPYLDARRAAIDSVAAAQSPLLDVDAASHV